MNLKLDMETKSCTNLFNFLKSFISVSIELSIIIFMLCRHMCFLICLVDFHGRSSFLVVLTLCGLGEYFILFIHLYNYLFYVLPAIVFSLASHFF